MNMGEEIVLLQEELKFEDERQEVQYAEFRRLCDLCPNDLDKIISSEQNSHSFSRNY